MGVLRKYTPWEREFREVWRKEQWFLRRYEKQKSSPLGNSAETLLPQKLTETLHKAFVQAFELVFEKGTGLICRAGRQTSRRQVYETQAWAVEEEESRDNLRAFSKTANRASAGNLVMAGAAGTGMGFLGIALPDVPLFVALLLKSVYETAESFGFPCKNEAEKIYVLRVMEAALSDGETLKRKGRALDLYAQTGTWPETVGLDRQIRATARQLSQFVLYSKALQSVPVAGAVGGIMDAVCLGRVQRYTAIKYQKRFLISRRLTDY